jgi:molybdopterin molybdotransferase
MGSHLPLAEARAVVLGQTRELPAEPVPLADALGRTLAEPVDAPHSLPPFDNSAMDGFALRAADTADASEQSPVTLRLSGESRAGTPEGNELKPGEAMKISTGAALPDGADAVLRVEWAVRPNDEHIAVERPLPPGNDVRPAGDDVSAGERVLETGMTIGPGELAMLASVGAAYPSCVRRPRVAIVTTGDELVAPGGTLEHGQIFDSNSVMLKALASAGGAEVVSVDAAVPDDAPTTNGVIAAALDRAEVLIVCGGVSVGEHDHVKPALEAAGVDQVFWQVAMRPGHPTYFGVRDGGGDGNVDGDGDGDGAGDEGASRKLIFGLPGNPVSAYATFHMFARPALMKLGGRAPFPPTVMARLSGELKKRAGHTQVLRCRMSRDERGWLAAPTSRNQRSHVISSVVGVQGLALLPEDATVLAAGEIVTVELMPDGTLETL